ncbi:FG-GAP-like repeat-containing protein [Kribbella sp. NBC_00382]|uniref:SpvB/TcaC N-terminal domain-containing protein n=1 Tax=Kribbella sp. NBC_00382 TaxID=2975967 RepID=UPI002E1D3F7A
MGGSTDAIVLPSGGGAMAGIGETFGPDPHTGTGNFTVPIALPPGRGGLQPQLQLGYSTGSGNGPFGLGWGLSLPGVSRRTGKGVPRYDEKRDVYLLSGGEELVAVGSNGPATLYRPRTEGLYARIARRRDGTDDYWQVTSKDGLVSTYGTPGSFGSDPATVADPLDRSRVLGWQLTRTADTFGSHIAYDYRRDSGVDGAHHWDQLYPERIRYVDNGPDYLVSVGLEYEERPDPFSDRRAGFEVRTRLRCTRIAVSTHAGQDQLVRTYDLTYSDQAANGISQLTRVTITGYDEAGGQESMPALVFGYTGFRPDQRSFTPVTGVNLPAVSLADPSLGLVDLAGNGLPDLVQLGDSARHWRNLGGGRFDVPKGLPDAPAGLSLADPAVRFVDANGDGRPDLMVTSGALSGYFPIRPGLGWDERSFRRFRQAPSFELSDPEVRLVDLDGDGVTDAIRSGARLECFFNDPVEGWHATRSIRSGPAFSFADPRVHWADLTGDGLQDVGLVHDGNLEYWPNLGLGNWGPPVSMRNAPRLPSGYDPARILVGDVDGDGLADLVYVDDDTVTLWINQSGNAWSDPITVRARAGYRGTPPLAGGDVRLVDLLGTGTVGVLWSRTGRSASMYFLDLTGGAKPYLLEQVDNSAGSVTTIEYAPSTRYFVEDDQHHLTRWRTALPFPVQVVAGAVVRDEFSGGSLRTSYRYRHGHWDGAEREFRGFAMVEQRDAEVLNGTDPPPTLTRTWFHPGPVGDEFGGWDAPDFSDAYWSGDPTLFEPTELPPQVREPAGRRIRRDALRALRGRALRTEVYAEDGGPRADRPYTVSETRYAVEQLTDRVFYPHSVAQRSTTWERGDDPMTSFAVSSFLADDGSFDPFGRPHSSTSIACPRGWRTMADRPATEFLVAHSRTEYAVPAAAETYLHELASASTGYSLSGTAGQTVAEVIADALAVGPRLEVDSHSVTHYDGEAFEGLPAGQVGAHGLPTRTRTLVLTDAIITEAYGGPPPYLKPATVWTGDYPAEFRTLLSPNAGYQREPGGWYATASQRFDERGLAVESRDPQWHEGNPQAHRVSSEYDEYGLLVLRNTDAAGLVTVAEPDYRVFLPRRVVDANGTDSRFTFSPLGLLTTSSVRGQSAAEGDAAAPTVEMTYDFSPPISLRTVRRIHHDTDLTVPADQRAATITTVEYSDGFGRLLQTRTQGDEVRFAEAGDDLVGQRAEPQHPNVVVNGLTVYDNKGREVEVYEPFFSTGWDYSPPPATGAKVTTTYDPLGRVSCTELADGSQELMIPGIPELTDPLRYEPTPWIAYTYDANDNAGRTHPASSQSYRHHYDTPGSVLVDALGRGIEMVARTREAVGDPIQEQVSRNRYDSKGNLLEVTDPLGRSAITSVYDLAGRALKVTELDSGTRATVYNATGAPVEHRDGRGALVLQGYDGLGRASRTWARERPDQEATLVVRAEYGDGGRPDQPPAERAAARTAYRLGRSYRQWDGAGLLTVERYDFAGRVTAKARQMVSDAALLAPEPFRADWTDTADPVLEASSFATDLQYDALGRTTQLMLPVDVDGDRKTLHLGYSSAGLLTSVRANDETYVERISYDAKGQRILIAHGNQTITRYTHDPQTRRLAGMRTHRFAAPAELVYRPTGQPLQDLSYQYDVSGNVVLINDRTPGCGVPGTPLGPDALDRVFEYDPLYRLRTASGRECAVPAATDYDVVPRCTDATQTRAYTETFRYDALGGLSELKHLAGGSGSTRTFTTVAGTNRLAGMTTGGGSSIGYTYDANGNVLSEGESRFFEWDHADRLRGYRTQAGAGPASVTAQYLYDAAGARVKKLVRSGGLTTVTLYVDGGFERCRRSGVGGDLANDTITVQDDRSRIATIRAGQAFPGDATPPAQYHLSDHLGSSTVVLDAAGAEVSREEYTPYGQTSFGGQSFKRYRYGGKERDEESGLNYHGARYYAPWLGRWMSPDPAGPVDGLHLYRFASSSPMRMADPSGLQSCDSSGCQGSSTATNVEESGKGSSGGTTAATPAPAAPPAAPAEPPPVDVKTQPDVPPRTEADKAYEAQAKAAFAKSRAQQGSFQQIAKSLFRSVSPDANALLPPAPRLQGMPPGMQQLTDPGKQDDIASAGGEVAKEIAEKGVTAASVAGDVGLVGVNIAVGQGGKAVANAVAEKAAETAVEKTVESAAPKAAPGLIARAAEIHAEIAKYVSPQTARKIAVAVGDGGGLRVVTVNNRAAYNLIVKKVVNLAEHEVLGIAPYKRYNYLRNYWRFTNLHAEELLIRSFRLVGVRGGEMATSLEGCWRCQTMINAANAIFRHAWTHLNPKQGEVLRHTAGFR